MAVSKDVSPGVGPAAANGGRGKSPCPAPSKLEPKSAEIAASSEKVPDDSANESRAASSTASFASWWGLLDALGSILFSVCLILVNKHIFSVLKFKLVLMTTAMHFLGTYAAMSVFRSRGMFQAKSPPCRWDTVGVSLWSVSSIVLMNMSLSWNSVGFYQMMKIILIPALVAVQMVLKGDAGVSPFAVAALLVLLLGLTLASVSDVTLTLDGAAVGALAVAATVGFQLGIQKTTQAYGLTATQLQYDIALPQAIFTLLLAVPIECRDPADIFAFIAARPVELPAYVALSVFLAMGVNYFAFALIGRFSAVTYQVVSHAKTILVFISGLIFFPVQMHGLELAKHVAGLCLAVVGIIWYSIAQARLPKTRKSQ